MSMNTELAREVALQIRKDDGAHWEQGSWWSGGDENGIGGMMPASDLLERKCGTTGCVAGWAVALSYPQAVFEGGVFSAGAVRSLAISAGARDLLNLNRAQAEWLFDVNDLDPVLWALENDDPDWEPGDYSRYLRQRSLDAATGAGTGG